MGCFPLNHGLGAENRNLLEFTVADGTLQMLECLLRGATKPDIYQLDDIGRHAFHHACKSGDIDKFMLLKKTYPTALEYLADRRTANGLTMLHHAITSGNVLLVEECLAAKCCPFAQDFYGRTCVSLAETKCKTQDAPRIKQLILQEQQKWKETYDEVSLAAKATHGLEKRPDGYTAYPLKKPLIN